jgi:TPP-dependent trihydroxycyclohexane-1,2-dione (THcHDO) dehydratase
MARTIRLTTAQALVRFLTAQKTLIKGRKTPIFAGVWAIFGHGNVAGIGEALYAHRKDINTYRGHNEQGMAHAATAFAKASNRRRMMAVTTSIGPGALNLVTAAAVAHVNRLPLLLLLQAGLALFRPHHQARATDPGPEPRHGGIDRSRRLRACDNFHLPGYASRGL